MSTRTRSWRRLVGVATLLLLVTAAACGDDDGGDVRSVDGGSGSGSASGSGSGSGAHGSGSGSGSGSASGAHGEEAACEEPAGGAGEGTLSATLTDYKITLDEPTAAAGATTLVASNEGQHPHEIVVAKGVTPDQLTYDAEGVVDEDALPKGAVLGEIEEFDPGKQCQAEFDLEPDTYTLFCNVVEGGESHAKMGMVTELTVE